LRLFYLPGVLSSGSNGVTWSWEDINLLPALQELGVDVIPYKHPHGYEYSPEELAHEMTLLLDTVQAEHQRRPIDIFWAYVVNRNFDPQVAQEIRRLGIITVHYSCNNTHQFHLVDRIAPAFDLCAFSERPSVEKFAAIGANPYWWPLAANPHVYKPYDLPREHEVVFVGSAHRDRIEAIDTLLRGGVRAEVWGRNWLPDAPRGPRALRLLRGLKQRLRHPRLAAAKARVASVTHPPLNFEEMVRLFSRAHLTLDLSAAPIELTPGGRRLLKVNLRDFEATMCGACHMVEYTDEIAEHFQPGEEIVCYRSFPEMAELARYYLQHPHRAKAIRRRARRRAARDHTWLRRWEALFAELRLPRERVWAGATANG